MSNTIGKNIVSKSMISFIVLATYFLVMMDTSITMTALDSIQQDFGLSEGALTWVQSAYVLTFGGFLLLGSKLSDNYGFKMIFLLGNIIFLVFSLLSGIAFNGTLLILSRGGQGLGAALISPTILGIINSIFEEENKKKQMIAYYSAVAGIGASAGLILGGFLTTYVSWRSCFLINIPICMIFIVYAYKKFPKFNYSKPQPIDLMGGITSIIAIFILILGLERMNTVINGINIALIIIGILLLIAFYFIEKRKALPLVNLDLFKNSVRTSGYILRFLFLSANFSLWYYLTLYFQRVYHFSPFETGLILIALTLFNFLIALNIHKKLKKSSNLKVLAQGLVFSIIGMIILIVVIINQMPVLYFIIPLSIIGIGQGYGFSPLTNLGMYNVNKENNGMASGLVNFSHQIGASSGIVIELILANAFINILALKDNVNTFTVLTVVVGLLIFIIMFIAVIGLQLKMRNIKG